jgi:hypothetical protein
MAIEYIGDRVPQPRRQWPLRPAPMPDELLSSWLNRIAVANGLAPWSFYLSLAAATGSRTSRILLVRGRDEVIVRKVHWTDAHCSKGLVDYLVDRSGCDAGLVQSLALCRPTEVPARDRTPKGTLQWSLLEAMPELLLSGASTAGSAPDYMRFCPYCLVESQDPWFRKFWRTSLANVCVRHECFLLSGCNCGAEIHPELLKEARPQAFCHTCGTDLRSMKPRPAGQREVNRQREINRRAYEGVEAILASGRSKRRIIRLIGQPTDHLCTLPNTGTIDAYGVNPAGSLLRVYKRARRRVRNRPDGGLRERLPILKNPRRFS